MRGLCVILLSAVLSQCLLSVFSKVYERCELFRELSKRKHRIPKEDVSTWVCIAQHESQYNTSAVGHLNADGSGDHGLFQISDLFWCSPPGVGLACGLNCDQLEDDDLTDDIVCARRIFRATKRRNGDGFTAWAVYGPHCKGDNSKYTQDCSNEVEASTTKKPIRRKPTTTTTTSTTEPADDDFLSTTELYEEYEEVSTEGERQIGGNDDQKPVVTRGLLQGQVRTSPTSLPRPSLPSDPYAAWLSIHYHPKFLDQFP